MNQMRITLAGLGAVLLLMAGNVAADSEFIRTMANITMSLNHFPSDEDKAALAAIVDNDESSDEEASIAMAISNLQHKVTGADVARLTDIVDDEDSDEAARKLAGILLRINHAASDDDKGALATLAGR